MIDFFGMALSLGGAALLASNVRVSAWGWVLFLLSNLAWIAYALANGPLTLAVQHVAFLATSLLGVWRYRRDLYHSLGRDNANGQGPHAPAERRP